MDAKNQLLTDDVRFLFSVFESHLRLVGGCVRDFLLHRGVHDFDFATPLSPDEVTERLRKNNISFYETGLKHGTVTVVLHHKNYEITSLRADVKTDGRHAEVAFGTSYAADARRRDFTINALYMDSSGQIFDYVNGLKDLTGPVVRFIGVPQQRIREDYLRLLRYFRFLSVLNSQVIDEEALKACVALQEGLKNISKERIREEFLKILTGQNSVFVLDLMNQYGLLNAFFKTVDIDGFKRFVSFYPKADALERLAVLCTDHSIPDWQWSRAQKKRLTVYQTPYALPQSQKTARLLLWQIGRPCFLFHLEKFRLTGRLPMAKYYAFKKLSMPVFPVRGSDFYQAGFRGAKIGRLLKAAQQKWIKMNLTSKKRLVIRSVLAYNKKYPFIQERKK